MRPVSFYDKGWRAMIPTTIYRAIHNAKFRGSTKLKNIFSLHPLDPEEWISKIIYHYLSENTIYIDVGAQHGRHFKDLLASEKHKNCLIIACEANYDLICQLKIRYDSFLDEKLIILHSAIADYTGEASFYINTLDTGYSGLRLRKIQGLGDKFKECYVNVTTIDILIQKYGQYGKKVSVIKIDVEGAELLVLNGALKVISEYSPIILFECANNGSTFYGYTLLSLIQWFHKIDYSVFTVNGIEVSESNADTIFDNSICCDFVACISNNKNYVSSVLNHIAS